MLGVRSFTQRVIQHGRQTLENVLQTGQVPKTLPFRRLPIPKQVKVQKIQAPAPRQSLTRQVFTGVFPRAVMQSAAAEWRRRVAVQLISGGLWRKAGNLPLFAFVGLAFSKQNDKDTLFTQIRDLHALSPKSASTEEHAYTLERLELGKLIATGCNAAVYEARFNCNTAGKDDDISILSEPTVEEVLDHREEIQSDAPSEVESNMDGSIIEGEESDLEINIIDSESEMSIVSDSDSDLIILDGETSDSELSILDGEGSDSELIILDGEMSDSELITLDETDDREDCDPVVLNMDLLLRELGGGRVGEGNMDVNTSSEYDLALKMMFNYDIESNAEAVSRAMAKEAVPACLAAGYPQDSIWNNGHHVKKKTVPPHPNIVRMYGVFVDSVPDIPDNIKHYPAALPPRLCSDGFGRNITMFLVMKRYTCTLTEYLREEKPSMRTRSLLLCQLLEGITFLHQHGIAHRDLKSDNLLIDMSAGAESPVLVISDFGCCLCAYEEDMQIPYVTSEISKGGNAALMAPEIACATAGKESVLDYRKSDLWAAGALIYEILGFENPFYRSSTKSSRLDSRTYREEELPTLPDNTPAVIKRLTRNILCRDPDKRMSPEAAATVVQLCLWGPDRWSKGDNTVTPDSVQEWVVNLAAELACHRTGPLHTDDIIKQIFLSRISYADLRSAVSLLQTV